jgi:hypothetical protein
MKSCPQQSDELVLRSDGCVDVRLAAAALWLTAHLSPSSGRGAWRQLLGKRCSQLLAAYPSSLEEDSAALARGGLASMEASVIAYRIGKKQVLRRWGR